MDNKRRRGLTTILITAAVLRIGYAYLVWTPAATSPDGPMPVRQMRSAYLLAAGYGYMQVLRGSPTYHDTDGRGGLMERVHSGETITPAMAGTVSEDGLYPETWHPPGWSILAWGLHLLTGLPVELPMQVSGILVDLAACGLLYWLTLFVLGSHRVAQVTALIYALFPPFAYSAVNLYPTVFTSFFVMLSTTFFVLGVHTDTYKQYIFYGMCGLTTGAASYFRPDYLLLGPFFIAGLWVYWHRFWRSVAIGVGILAVSLATLFPWAYRNYKSAGQWLFTSSSLGGGLINELGMYPNPWGFGPYDVDRDREAAAQGIPTAWNIEADTYFRKVFVEAVKAHPDAYLKILLKRCWEPIATPHDWGLKVKARTIPFSEIRNQDKILSSVGYIIRAFWPQVISCGVMFISLIGLLFMLLREWRRRPLIIFIFLVPLYAALSHIFTVMFPYYLLPGAFAQVMGLGYLLTGDWGFRHNYS